MIMPLFTFDDGNESDIFAARVIQEHGMKGVFFVNDKPNVRELVEELLKLGMYVGNHTASHPDMRTLTAEQVYTEVVGFNHFLESIGASGEWFSYPYSQRPEQGMHHIKTQFKYIYKGYDEPTPDRDGEISRVSVVGKSEDVILGYLDKNIPLQLHMLDGNNPIAIPKDQFVKYVRYAKRNIR